MGEGARVNVPERGGKAADGAQVQNRTSPTDRPTTVREFIRAERADDDGRARVWHRDATVVSIAGDGGHSAAPNRDG